MIASIPGHPSRPKWTGTKPGRFGMPRHGTARSGGPCLGRPKYVTWPTAQLERGGPDNDPNIIFLPPRLPAAILRDSRQTRSFFQLPRNTVISNKQDHLAHFTSRPCFQLNECLNCELFYTRETILVISEVHVTGVIAFQGETMHGLVCCAFGMN
jgi:hypothetical protein